MQDTHILVVEDEAKIGRVIRLELEYEGYKVDMAEDGKTSIEKFYDHHYDLVLLDILLPELNGIDVLRRIRSGSSVPVILLTAKDSTSDKVYGLDEGADDYVAKPFQFEELLARIRACMRTHRATHKEQKDHVLQIEDLLVNEDTRDVFKGSTNIELTPREFDLLVYLMKNEKQVVSREQILLKVWGDDYFGDTNIVDVYIRYLRKKIDHGFETQLIHTVHGVGYTLKGS